MARFLRHDQLEADEVEVGDVGDRRRLALGHAEGREVRVPEVRELATDPLARHDQPGRRRGHKDLRRDEFVTSARWGFGTQRVDTLGVVITSAVNS